MCVCARNHMQANKIFSIPNNEKFQLCFNSVVIISSMRNADRQGWMNFKSQLVYVSENIKKDSS